MVVASSQGGGWILPANRPMHWHSSFSTESPFLRAPRSLPSPQGRCFAPRPETATRRTRGKTVLGVVLSPELYEGRPAVPSGGLGFPPVTPQSRECCRTCRIRRTRRDIPARSSGPYTSDRDCPASGRQPPE